MKNAKIYFVTKLNKVNNRISVSNCYLIFIVLTIFIIVAPNKVISAQLSINQFGNLSLDGSIESGDYHSLIDLVRKDKIDKHTIIELNSSGGNLMEALRIAHYISLNGMSTLTLSRCESACVLILFSGKRYGASSNAIISLHKPYIDSNDGRIVDKIGSDTWWRIYGLLLSSLKDDEIANSILGFMYSTEKHSVYTIEPKQFKLFGIISN